ncbi:alpha/beta hydrolase [Hymenobacter sp. BT507]|uniref:Alpha/beta hydrolase n=1 Tax=Hymenobacter citatus TaxID=2763506 RepID=A0ABR7MQ85_9BACT|nr:alpha/beta hydrolase [Hymenobacter citatus]MBC6613246.1 alpha/beta hydrolase [Hymenobacter citatus]
MKKTTTLLLLLCVSMATAFAQIVDSKVVENGSSGPYKAIAATEASLPNYVVYRPKDVKAAAKAEGKLPIIVFGNGGCSNTSITHEKVLSEIASRGYVIVAIGPLARTLAPKPTSTESSMLLDAVTWITAQSKDKKSEYYQRVATDKIAAMGQSCGGAQTLYVSSDPRIKTSILFNAGIGNMTMAGASKASLQQLHGPIAYIVGGPSDIAYANAELDYDRIDTVPVALATLTAKGHMGTFDEAFGGSFSQMALAWLDWQLKGKNSRSTVFLDKDLGKFPGWSVKAKRF